MFLAAIGDIRGNVFALKAVLAEIEAQGIETILHTGNAVLGSRHSCEILQLLDYYSIYTVQGILDRLLVRFGRKPESCRKQLDPEAYSACAEAFGALDSAGVEWLRRLPKRLPLSLESISILLCHGSPANQHEVLGPDADRVRFQRQREAVSADLVICGGAEEPFSREVDGTFFVCPGFLEAGPRQARWARIDTEGDPWRIDFPLVEYAPPESHAG